MLSLFTGLSQSMLSQKNLYLYIIQVIVSLIFLHSWFCSLILHKLIDSISNHYIRHKAFQILFPKQQDDVKSKFLFSIKRYAA
ncbi:hypothetical protein P343_16370 [Sporolactobacillus laevolacticus DSM 442]|uniref:Uncharacterized protein n=1 Tax=Sporolactobacillus laevolacticus DSM 442 TaxID=1395513 RepID=V6IUI4_9BACL|nr:hypothetical protein P343_16370 [Sporolactobacillus laevolacticus DSM 442]